MCALLGDGQGHAVVVILVADPDAFALPDDAQVISPGGARSGKSQVGEGEGNGHSRHEAVIVWGAAEVFRDSQLTWHFSCTIKRASAYK